MWQKVGEDEPVRARKRKAIGTRAQLSAYIDVAVLDTAKRVARRRDPFANQSHLTEIALRRLLEQQNEPLIRDEDMVPRETGQEYE